MLWLFQFAPEELKRWKVADRHARRQEFSPVKVRVKLDQLSPHGAAIKQERYELLCEVGTHPVPGFAPGHFDGSGRPTLGQRYQQVGAMVAATELGLAVSSCSLPFSVLLEIGPSVASQLSSKSVQLVISLGKVSILNYEQIIREVLKVPLQDLPTA